MKGVDKKQSGFTLIELVVVVAVVGVLAIVAMPKMLGTTTDARTAALTGVATALTSASTHNYLIRGADNRNGFPITTCVSVGDAMHGGTAKLTADGYTITEIATNLMSTEADVLNAVDTPVDCTLSTINTPVLTTTFSAIGIK